VSEPVRDPCDVLGEAVGLLALAATRRLYEEQPQLWELGESGRARVLEDFSHHFRALALLDAGLFEAHVAWCRGLFTTRGFPTRWLDWSWPIMEEVVAVEMPAPVSSRVSRILSRLMGHPS